MIRQAAAVVVVLCLSASPLHAQSAPSSSTLTVSEASAAVRKAPSVASPVIGTAARGAALLVTREVGDWVKVSWPASADGFGYVRVSSLSRHAPAAAPAAIANAPASTAAKPAPTTARTASSPAKSSTTKAAPASATTTDTPVEPAPAMANAFAASRRQPAPLPLAVGSEQTPVVRSSAPSPAQSLYVTPSHTVGVGAVTGSTGFGGSARAWKNGRIGVQLEVSRDSYDSVDLLSRASVTDIAPGLLFALNDRVTDSLWVRPYVGVGVRLARVARTDLIFPDMNDSASTLGARVFAGGEFSLASAPQLALSADVGYYKMPEPFAGFEPSGIGLAISAHWYLR